MSALASVGMAMVAALWTVPTGEVWLDGSATHYSAGLMGKVAANRGMSLDGYVGGVALNRAGDLGRKVWIEWTEGPFEGVTDGPFLVVDCARRGADYQARIGAGYVIEVSEGWAMRREFAWVGPVKVRVWFVDPRGESGDLVWH